MYPILQVCRKFRNQEPMPEPWARSYDMLPWCSYIWSGQSEYTSNIT